MKWYRRWRSGRAIDSPDFWWWYNVEQMAAFAISVLLGVPATIAISAWLMR